MDFGLQGRTAVVTGSSSGIGRSTAELLGREGARVAVTYCTNERGAQEAVAGICAAGGEAFAVRVDLASIGSIRAGVAAVRERWGGVDVLVNNAVAWGLRTPATAPPFERLSPAEWQDGLRTNLEGTFAMVQAVLPSMRERGWGRIVSVSSVAARDGLAGAGWYSAAKAGLHGLTRTLAREVGTAGVLANVVMPGLTMTGPVVTLPPAVHENASAASAIGRVLEAKDVASVIGFLCSAANTAITGQIIRTSGSV
jgi:3-oxoacyl-[acyl-carrier protein] reductase